MESQRLKLQYVAEHDDFLDVCNRRTLIGMVEALPDHSGYALVVVNLNGFKGINDTYGHKEADRILVQLSGHLKQSAMENGGVVARLRNDEFLRLYADKALDEACPARTFPPLLRRPARRFHRLFA